jgi:Flp pilus assembly protein TadG
MSTGREAWARARVRDGESGSSTVEFVIGTALMVTMLTVIVQFALYFHLRAVAQTAAREGLDHVRVVEGSPDDGIATANEFLDQAGQSLEARQVTAERSPSTSSLTVSGNVVSVVPGLNLRVEVTVDAPTERVTP